MTGTVQDRKRKLVLPAPPLRPNARNVQSNQNAILAQATSPATCLAESPRQARAAPVSHPGHDLDWGDDLLGENAFSEAYETLLQLRSLCALPADVSLQGLGGLPRPCPRPYPGRRSVLWACLGHRCHATP